MLTPDASKSPVRAISTFRTSSDRGRVTSPHGPPRDRVDLVLCYPLRHFLAPLCVVFAFFAAEWLIAMGARIEGAGTAEIHIEGVDDLHPIEHTIIPDRIEAGTFLVSAAATGGKVRLLDSAPHLLDVIVDKLREAGATICSGADWIELVFSRGLYGILPFSVSVNSASTL